MFVYKINSAENQKLLFISDDANAARKMYSIYTDANIPVIFSSAKSETITDLDNIPEITVIQKRPSNKYHLASIAKSEHYDEDADDRYIVKSAHNDFDVENNSFGEIYEDFINSEKSEIYKRTLKSSLAALDCNASQNCDSVIPVEICSLTKSEIDMILTTGISHETLFVDCIPDDKPEYYESEDESFKLVYHPDKQRRISFKTSALDELEYACFGLFLDYVSASSNVTLEIADDYSIDELCDFSIAKEIQECILKQFETIFPNTNIEIQ